MNMQMMQTVLVSVDMTMRATFPEPVENARTEIDDHHSDSKLEECFRARGNRFTEEDQHPTNRQQSRRMSQAPDAASQNKCVA